MSTSPLAGKTVLVTRAATQSSQFSDRLQDCNAIVIDMPALEIVPPSSWDDLDDAIAQLDDFDWLVLTSSNAVDYFFQRLQVQNLDVADLDRIRIAVVGDKTARVLAQWGREPDFVPPAFVADSLAEHFPGNLDGAQVLFARVESGGRDALVKDLTAKGAQVTEVAAYQSTCPRAIAPAALAALQNQRVDIITFASSKTVKHFCQLLERTQPDASWQAWLERVCIASIGPQTSHACKTLLGRVDAEAQEYTLDGLIIAIEQWLNRFA
jgi:uroporphyrinogen III methyltransferase / synthase